MCPLLLDLPYANAFGIAISDKPTSGFGIPASSANSWTIWWMWGASASDSGLTCIERFTKLGPNQYCKNTIIKLTPQYNFQLAMPKYNPTSIIRKYTMENITTNVRIILNLSFHVFFILTP